LKEDSGIDIDEVEVATGMEEDSGINVDEKFAMEHILNEFLDEFGIGKMSALSCM
jgi:hypothetical protein